MNYPSSLWTLSQTYYKQIVCGIGNSSCTDGPNGSYFFYALFPGNSPNTGKPGGFIIATDGYPLNKIYITTNYFHLGEWKSITLS